MAGINTYWGNTFVTEIARTSTQGHQFGSVGSSVEISYVTRWGWPDNQYPRIKDVGETWQFGLYPAEFLNATMPSNYMSSRTVQNTEPSRVFYWQYHNDVSSKAGSVGFTFPGRTSLAFDTINEKYI